MVVVFTIAPLVAVTVTTPFRTGAASTLRLSTCVAVFAELSATFTVKPLTPTAVGVPVIAPLDPPMLNPGGNVPEPLNMEYVYGGLPPLAMQLALL